MAELPLHSYLYWCRPCRRWWPAALDCCPACGAAWTQSSPTEFSGWAAAYELAATPEGRQAALDRAPLGKASAGKPRQHWASKLDDLVEIKAS